MMLSELIYYATEMLKKFGDHEIYIQGQKPAKNEDLHIVFSSSVPSDHEHYTLRNLAK
jgi:hypothetical protein